LAVIRPPIPSTDQFRSQRRHAGISGNGAVFSPAQLNPMGFNPLRDMLEQQIDFERLRKARQHQIVQLPPRKSVPVP